MTPQWDNDKPIYIQLYTKMMAQIVEGHIKEGEALPSVRNISSGYNLNPLTVSKAYQMLQDKQIIEKRRGQGLFVKPGAQEMMLDLERELFLKDEWPRIVKKFTRLKLSPSELLAQI
jgi:GntR family transcriptional regulator